MACPGAARSPGHLDWASRSQVVDADVNPRYYRLISRFADATGVPVLLNASFSLEGEPIVTTPRGVLRMFQRSGIDVLVMENFVARKER